MIFEQSAFLTIFFLASSVLANNWATYPQVPKTATINGFADPIYDTLPSCAKDCVKFNTGNTPCPYWDTGCFCVMPQWSGLVGQCIAENCKGEEVVSATYLATSLCYKVGANTWMMPASISTALSLAAGDAKQASATATVSDSNSSATDSSSSNASATSSTQASATNPSQAAAAGSSGANSSSTAPTSAPPSSTTASSSTTGSASSSSPSSTASSSRNDSLMINYGLFTLFVSLLFSMFSI